MEGKEGELFFHSFSPLFIDHLTYICYIFKCCIWHPLSIYAKKALPTPMICGKIGLEEFCVSRVTLVDDLPASRAKGLDTLPPLCYHFRR